MAPITMPVSPPPSRGDSSETDRVANGSPKLRVNGNGSPQRVFHSGRQNGSAVSPHTQYVHVEDEEEDDPAAEPLRHTSSYPVRPLGPREEEAGDSQSRSHATIRSYSDDEREAVFPRISKPVELMRNSYDCVVIGSGYGGAVAASRMARAYDDRGGRNSVCVLERGKERWPGEYPAGVKEAVKNLHMSGEFTPGLLPSKTVEEGDPTGMYHLVFGNGMNAIVGNGLGGTSLMNANVFLRADKATLSMPVWPDEIRSDQDCLDTYYKKVEDVLEPTPYPDDWPDLPKVELFKKQAELLGMKDKFYRVPQTTRFRNGPNSCGVEMSPSALTGQDATGVNDGSKTTTLVTYLADAWNWGAEMFCECEVRYIKEAKCPEGGYIVYFTWHGRNRGVFKDNFHSDLMWVHAKKCVFLGAGAIGTTEILLRSKEMGLDMSDRVGENMSGNGDMLAFGYNTDYEANAVGKAFPNPYNPIGPTINSVIDNREGHANPLDGYVIEEGCIPKALSPFLQIMLELSPGRIEPEGEDIPEKIRSKLARLGSMLFGPYFQRGAMDNTQVYLVMSHDSSQAILRLKNDKPVLEFLGISRSDNVRKLNQILADATQKVGGTFVQNPFYAWMGGQQVTVHPIGGACMSNDNTGSAGVTNHCGELFKGSGSETHSGLIVMDGSIIPAALGVNPFATITALAERSVDYYARKNGLTFREEKNGILDLFRDPAHPVLKPCEEGNLLLECGELKEASSIISDAEAIKASGFGFTEVMSGFVHRDDEHAMAADEREVYCRAYKAAKGLCESARFFLSVQAFDTKLLIQKADHPAMLTGTFVCPTLPGSPFMVRRGDFGLFVVDMKAPGTRNLTYDFDMRGTDRQLYHFHGYKVVDSAVALSVKQFWKATTTLYVTITRPPKSRKLHDGPDAWRRGEVVAKGIMRINPKDFSSQIMTIAPTGRGVLKKMLATASFVTYFTRKSMNLFLGPFAPQQYPTITHTGFINDTPPNQSVVIVARDEIKTRMHVWESTNPNLPTRNLFMIPGASVDHQIFALPTIPYNAVNYFTRAGYRVFVTIHRIGQLMVAQNDWTTYDARLDIRACLEYIRDNFPDGNTPEGNKVYTVAHCMGSVAYSAGLLSGDIPSEWIQGISTSQVFMNPIWNTLNMAKVMAGPIPLDRFYKMVAGNWFSISSSKDDCLVQRILNQILRFYPDTRSEICNNVSCHRCSLVFGRLWNHRNLNEATHRQVNRFFGGVNMTLLRLLMKQGFEGNVMNNDFVELTSDENIERLKGIPMMFFVGSDNGVLTPAATEKTYEVLCERFGSSDADGNVQYRRRVVPGYGHLDCWMGRNSWKDVYPFVREEVDRVVRGEDYKFVEPEDRFTEMIRDGVVLY